MLDQSSAADVKKAIKAQKAKRVLIQLPEGLKTKAQDIVKQIEDLGVDAVLWVDPCFGACDIPDIQAKRLGVDLIVHLGHSPLGPKPKIPVVYVEYRSEKDPSLALADNIDVLGDYDNLGLVTTVQHIGFIDKVKGILENEGHNVFIGKPKRATYPGQVLGCDQSAAKEIEKKVDAFLYFGTGRFHPLGILRATGKPVFCLDIEQGEIEQIKDDTKYDSIATLKKLRFDEAEKVGLIVTTKLGQNEKDIFKIKKEIEKMGKEVTLIATDYVSEEKILGMEFDILVNTACPRLEEDVIFKTSLVNWSTIKRLEKH